MYKLILITNLSNLTIDEVNILNKFRTKIVDVEELHKLGKKNKFCPYYYEKKLEVSK